MDTLQAQACASDLTANNCESLNVQNLEQLEADQSISVRSGNNEFARGEK